ncbi:metallophosphoesterase family protein [Zunongwangia sp.]|uniref:metallophosphoesterase family protein n=1 Tax=Zunongwangia sp. TaxID=1965325 RepID=UPI003AA857CA
MARTFAIGDIHGGLKALQQLLEKIEITENDQLIFLGDYVDGWSDSANVISFLIELGKKYTCIFLRGNHDDLVQQWLQDQSYTDKWIEHGGQSSIDSYAKLSEETIQSHLSFFQELQNYYIDTENRLFLHAGFTNLHGPEYEYYSTGFYWDRTLWETVLALDPKLKKNHPFYPKRIKLFNEIYIGHTPVTRIGEDEPIQKANVWNVDTGAAFKGKLSAINIDTKKVHQSAPVYTFYPDENGRN